MKKILATILLIIPLAFSGHAMAGDIDIGNGSGAIDLDNAVLSEVKAAIDAKRTYPTADETKLAGVETGSTADQTGAELETLLDSELGSTDWKTGGTDDQTASEVTFTPEGSIAATTVQGAIQEVRDEAGSAVITLATNLAGDETDEAPTVAAVNNGLDGKADKSGSSFTALAATDIAHALGSVIAYGDYADGDSMYAVTSNTCNGSTYAINDVFTVPTGGCSAGTAYLRTSYPTEGGGGVTVKAVAPVYDDKVGLFWDSALNTLAYRDTAGYYPVTLGSLVTLSATVSECTFADGYDFGYNGDQLSGSLHGCLSDTAILGVDTGSVVGAVGRTGNGIQLDAANESLSFTSTQGYCSTELSVDVYLSAATGSNTVFETTYDDSNKLYVYFVNQTINYRYTGSGVHVTGSHDKSITTSQWVTVQLDTDCTNSYDGSTAGIRVRIDLNGDGDYDDTNEGYSYEADTDPVGAMASNPTSFQFGEGSSSQGNVDVMYIDNAFINW